LVIERAVINIQVPCKAKSLFYLFILTENGFLPGGSGAAIRHNTQITHHTQTKQHTKVHNQ
jgi:hypothetical protein